MSIAVTLNTCLARGSKKARVTGGKKNNPATPLTSQEFGRRSFHLSGGLQQQGRLFVALSHAGCGPWGESSAGPTPGLCRAGMKEPLATQMLSREVAVEGTHLQFPRHDLRVRRYSHGSLD